MGVKKKGLKDIVKEISMEVSALTPKQQVVVFVFWAKRYSENNINLSKQFAQLGKKALNKVSKSEKKVFDAVIYLANLEEN